MNQAGPIAAVFTAAVLGGAGVGSSFLGAEFREPVGGTPSNTFSEDVPDGASSSGAYTMGGLDQLASVAAEMQYTLAEHAGAAVSDTPARRLFSSDAPQQPFVGPQPSSVDVEPLTRCAGLVYQPPRNAQDVDRVAGRIAGFNKLVQEALRNKASMYSAGAESLFMTDTKGWWSGCTGFLLQKRPSNVALQDGMVDKLSQTSEPPSSGPEAIWHLLFDAGDGSEINSVFRHPRCDGSPSCAHCCTNNGGFKKNFIRSVEQAGSVPSNHKCVPHKVMLSSPRKAKHLVKTLRARVAELKKDKVRLQALLDACPDGALSDDAEDLLQSDEVMGYVKKTFGADSDGAAVWQCMMSNARASSKGTRRGNRYPDVVIRMCVQLLTKCGNHTYETLSGMFFLPHLRTIQHHRYFSRPLWLGEIIRSFYTSS